MRKCYYVFNPGKAAIHEVWLEEGTEDSTEFAYSEATFSPDGDYLGCNEELNLWEMEWDGDWDEAVTHYWDCFYGDCG